MGGRIGHVRSGGFAFQRHENMSGHRTSHGYATISDPNRDRIGTQRGPVQQLDLHTLVDAMFPQTLLIEGVRLNRSHCGTRAGLQVDNVHKQSFQNQLVVQLILK